MASGYAATGGGLTLANSCVKPITRSSRRAPKLFAERTRRELLATGEKGRGRRAETHDELSISARSGLYDALPRTAPAAVRA
jgi:hypothetical protein